MIRFNSLAVDDGLVNNAVRAIAQDKYGYIWFGTELGLSRFDGHNLINYQANVNNGLSGSYVNSLSLDSNGELWIGTQTNGINTYLPATDSFRSIETNNSELTSNHINSLVADNRHGIWIGTDKGLEHYDIKNHIFSNFHNQLNSTSAPLTNVKSLLLTQNEDLWIGTSRGLAFLQKQTQTPIRIKLTETEQPYVKALTEDNRGNIWIGTSKGLFFYDKTSQKISKDIRVIKKQFVLSLLVDQSENLWIGTLENGVYKITTNGEYSHHINDKGDDKSLGDKTVLSLFQDNSGIIWMGTYDAGIHWFDPALLSMGAHDKSLSSVSCLPSSLIFSTLIATEDSIFIGTDRGLSLFNFKKNQCQSFFQLKPGSHSISDNEILTIFKDSSDKLWVGTQKGIASLDINTGIFTRYSPNLSDKSVSSIKESSDKRLILGTNSGIYLSNIEKTEFVLFPSDKQIENIQINTMIWDQSGNLWVGSNKGLLFISQQLNKAELVYAEPEENFTTQILSISLKNETTLLISIEERGLFEFNTKTKTVRSVSEQFNIPLLQSFLGFHEDAEGYLWLKTRNSGLYRFHPEKQGSTHYQYTDGLISSYISPRSSLTLPNGELFFGSRTGFSLFNPSDIQKNIRPAKVTISNLYLNGEQVKPLINYNGFSIEKPILELKEMVLEHDNNSLGFEFRAFHYANPEKNKYAHKLEGVNNNWVMTNAGNNGVTFDDLSAGDYLLRVKAASKNDVWSEEKTLKFTILPAPWLTWWAYSIYIISLILLVFFVIHKRTQLLKARALSLEKTIALRTSELQNEKQKVEQLLSRKNEEFANVSHEFRTPLTLILGPLAQVLKTNKNEDEISRLNIVQRNGYRLLRMVDQLLNLETFKLKSITQKSPQATAKIIKLLTEAFIDLAKEKNIVLSIKQIAEVNFELTTDSLEKIVLNLLSNAIKYTKAGGTIQVYSKRTVNNELEIQVQDSGIGIPENKLNSIFERYNRVLDENSEQVTGAGIGLSLVKNLVELHQGRIEVESELGKGTTIAIYLPIIGEVDDNQVNSHSNDEIIAMELMSLTNQTLPISQDVHSYETKIDNNSPLVLVVEDNKDMLSFIVESINDEYQVITAFDGEEGVKTAISEVPDLIISDVMMPKMDGYEATKMLRNNNITNHIPIILLTARGDRESRLKGWHEQADEYLTKPFDVEELKIRLKNLLDIRNILKKRFAETTFLPGHETATEFSSDIDPSKNSQHEKFIAKLNGIIENIYTEPSLSVNSIAKKIAMSERQFYRKLRGILDMSPTEYLRRFRLEKAKILLNEGYGTSYSAFEVGFSSQSYFGKCFRAQYGLSPGDFKKEKKSNSLKNNTKVGI